MRELSLKDVFTVSRILKKMQIRFEFEGNVSQNQLASLFIQAFIENIGAAEKEVMEFLADLKGVKAKDLEGYSLDETFDLIMEFKEVPGLASFFTRVSKLMN
ncbi:MAG: hypothetical protein ABIR91_02505 [Candidatus Saccharimonadales bacterium]